MSAELVAAWATAIGVLVAAVGVVVAYWQLSNLNATLKMNTLAVVLQIETEMNARKQAVDEVASNIQIECAKSHRNQATINALQGKLDGFLENWLNSVDRLAFCILKGFLSERDWKVEYRDYLNTLVSDHREKFNVDSPYTNIKDLHHRWMRV